MILVTLGVSGAGLVIGAYAGLIIGHQVSYRILKRLVMKDLEKHLQDTDA